MQVIMNMFALGNLQMENLQNQNASPLTLPQHQPMPQLQTLTQHQLLQDPPRIVKVNNFKSLHLGREMLMIKIKSQIWDHFTKLDGDPTTPRAECNYCGKDYACHTIINGTSNMWSYLKACKKFPFVVDKKQNILVLELNKVGGELGDPSMGTLKAISYDYDECKKALVKMVIIDELPFNFVEGKRLRLFSRTLQPRFDVPSRFTIMRDCLKLYVEEKERLKRALKGQRLCLITDTRTSIQNINYMSLTAHWIDNEWNLHKKILNFCQVSNHMGETIGQVIENCLLDWGINKL